MFDGKKWNYQSYQSIQFLRVGDTGKGGYFHGLNNLLHWALSVSMFLHVDFTSQ